LVTLYSKVLFVNIIYALVNMNNMNNEQYIFFVMLEKSRINIHRLFTLTAHLLYERWPERMEKLG